MVTKRNRVKIRMGGKAAWKQKTHYKTQKKKNMAINRMKRNLTIKNMIKTIALKAIKSARFRYYAHCCTAIPLKNAAKTFFLRRKSKKTFYCWGADKLDLLPIAFDKGKRVEWMMERMSDGRGWIWFRGGLWKRANSGKSQESR